MQPRGSTLDSTFGPPTARAGGRRLGTAVLLGWLVLGGLSPSPWGPAPAPGADRTPQSAQPHAPDRLLLKLRAGGPGWSAPGLRGALGGALASARPLLRRAPRGPVAGGLDRLFEVRVPPGTDVPRLAAKLSRLTALEYAEPVWLYQIVDETAGAPRVALEPVTPQAVPNDPAYVGGQQAYLDRLQVEAAWDLQKSEAGSPRPVVCIVDGGTDWQHEDLLANVWTNPGEIAGNGLDDDANGFVDDIRGWNFRDNTNNPRGSSATPNNRNHGTHTAGLAAAVTGNGIGVGSASWNPLIMPVNASSQGDGFIAHGYEGILYAIENGADIVSLSFGGFAASLAGQDIVDYAISQGTLLVAAAGNNNTSQPFYPAAYRGVVAVANVTNGDQRYSGASASNNGGWLDVAAPGTDLYSTLDNGTTNAYGLNTGTSMSCPVAAAVAALIKAQHPGWGPLKVGEQLRVSCDDINAVNPGFEDRLGKGRINALRALSLASPALRATSWSFVDADGNGQLNQGESATMTVMVHNYHDDATAPSFSLSSPSPWVTITDGAQASATILEDGETTLPSAFGFTVHPDVPPGTQVELRIDMSAPGYSDFQYLAITLEPAFQTHDVNAITVSLTGTGGIGWIGFPGNPGEDGEGFSVQGGPNLLFEGAFLVGTGPSRLSDAARTTGEHSDFAPDLHGAPDRLTPGPQEDQEIHGAFTDSINVGTPLGVRVGMSSWAHASAPFDDFVIVSYEIQNRTGAPLSGLWAGLWLDWDIDENHYDTNRAAYDATRRLGYAWDNAVGLPHVGVMALSGPAPGFSAIRNDGVGMPWSLSNGFDKSEKWDVLEGGTGVLSAGPADVSAALSSGPYQIPPGAKVTVCFALVAGSNLAVLQANADRALEFFGTITTSVPRGSSAARVPVAALGPATPNPFDGSTRFQLELLEPGSVSVEVFDAGGRRVRTLTAGPRASGRHVIDWDGRDAAGRPVASGTYFARLRSGVAQQVRTIVLAR